MHHRCRMRGGTAIAEAARDLNATRGRWLDPVDASEADQKKRSLTTLSNQRPAWLHGCARPGWPGCGTGFGTWREPRGEGDDLPDFHDALTNINL
jgi:hypothetical protein